MRILVPVDGSGSANRTTVYAVSLVDGCPDEEITLLSVQNQGTLDTSNISARRLDFPRVTVPRQRRQFSPQRVAKQRLQRPSREPSLAAALEMVTRISSL